jgi:hypothetical protein
MRTVGLPAPGISDNRCQIGPLKRLASCLTGLVRVSHQNGRIPELLASRAEII